LSTGIKYNTPVSKVFLADGPKVNLLIHIDRVASQNAYELVWWGIN